MVSRTPDKSSIGNTHDTSVCILPTHHLSGVLSRASSKVVAMTSCLFFVLMKPLSLP